jgi:hypothetical protein
MGKINLARVIVGGLLAGLIINVGEFLLNEVILGQRWADAFKARGLPAMGGTEMAYMVVVSFAFGLVMIWVYAAIRPRMGAGPKTAVCAGLIVWALAYLLPSASAAAMHMFPRRLILYGTLWGVFELIIAALAGAWLYKEEA